MNYVGKKIKTDTETLWKTGYYKFPELAESYADANRRLYDSGSGLQSNFIGPDGTSPVFAKWRVLKDDLLDIFDRTAQNLVDTGTALCTVASTYAADDDEAAENLAKLEEEAEQSDEKPPTSISTKSSDDPLYEDKPTNVEVY